MRNTNSVSSEESGVNFSRRLPFELNQELQHNAEVSQWNQRGIYVERWRFNWIRNSLQASSLERPESKSAKIRERIKAKKQRQRGVSHFFCENHVHPTNQERKNEISLSIFFFQTIKRASTRTGDKNIYATKPNKRSTTKPNKSRKSKETKQQRERETKERKT